MRQLEHIVDGELWMFRFLDTCSIIPEEERIEIMEQAVRMDSKNRRHRKQKIKGGHYEGILWSTGKYYMISGFGGYEYRAKIDTNQGKYAIGILIQKLIDPSLN